MNDFKIVMALIMGFLIVGCTYDNEEDLGITQPGSSGEEQRVIDFQTEVRPIIDAKCSIPGCHVAGTSRANLTIDSEVSRRAANISQRVQSGNMPRTGTISFEQKDILISWVNQGAELN